MKVYTQKDLILKKIETIKFDINKFLEYIVVANLVKLLFRKKYTCLTEPSNLLFV